MRQVERASAFRIAKYNLALSYRDGTGVKRNRQKALELLTQAVNQGYKDAVETIYKIGLDSVDSNDEFAARCYAVAASQGHIEAKERLSYLHKK